MAQTVVVNSRGLYAPTRLTKAANDAIAVAVDFNLFFGSETIGGYTITTDDGITQSGSAYASGVVSTVVSGGTDVGIYDLTVKAIGSSQTKEVVVQIAVIDTDTQYLPDYGVLP